MVILNGFNSQWNNEKRWINGLNNNNFIETHWPLTLYNYYFNLTYNEKNIPDFHGITFKEKITSRYFETF